MKNALLLLSILLLFSLTSSATENENNAASPESCNARYSLSGNLWRQVSLPCVPAGSGSVADVFGDDMAEAFGAGAPTYNTNWVVYKYDLSTSSGYIKLEETDTLDPGIGYWIIQLSGGDATLALPANSTPAPNIKSDACPSDQGCFEIPLKTKIDGVGWSMIGRPSHFSSKLGDTRILANTGACSGGCDLDIANSGGLVSNQLWTFDGSNYALVNNPGGSLEPWVGYWAATLQSAHGKSPKLLVPKLPEDTETLVLNDLKAFPTAYGAGALTKGGRGNIVVKVTNLNDSGIGSFRDALYNPSFQGKNRTIIFDVGGVVDVKATDWDIGKDKDKARLTVAGQTAHDLGGIYFRTVPGSDSGDSYTMKEFESVILRYITTIGVPGYDETKAGRGAVFTVGSSSELIVDHFTGAHGKYQLGLGGLPRNTKYKSVNASIQFSLSAEPLSGHAVTGVLGYEYGDTVLMQDESGDYLFDRTDPASYNSTNAIALRDARYHGFRYHFDAHYNTAILSGHRQPYKTYGGNNSWFVLKNNYTYDWDSRAGTHDGNAIHELVNNVFEKGQNITGGWEDDIIKHLSKTSFSNYRDPNNHYDQTFPDAEVIPRLYVSGNRWYDKVGTVIIDDDNQRKMITLYPSERWIDPPSWVEWFHDYGIEEDGFIPQQYFLDNPQPRKKHAANLWAADKVKAKVLKLAGAGFRIGSTGVGNASPVDTKYFEIAKNKSEGVIQVGLESRVLDIGRSYQFPTTNSRSHNYDSDTVYNDGGTINHESSNNNPGFGLPDEWEELHGVSDRNGVKIDWVIDGIKIKNLAGYSNLEIFLNEKAGDFHLLKQKHMR